MAKAHTTGQLIRNRRKFLGLTQREVAKACEVTASAVTQWEADLTSAIKHIKPLCRVLKTTPAEIGLVDPAADSQTITMITSGPLLEVQGVQPIILSDGKAGLALVGQEGRSIVLEASRSLISAMRVALDAIEALQRR